jgi:hypothetical protein
MSPVVKTSIGVILLLSIAGGLYWYLVMNKKAPVPQATVEQTLVSTTPPVVTLPSGTEATDAALAQDLGAVDANLNGFATDNTDISNGLSDTPVQQASL